MAKRDFSQIAFDTVRIATGEQPLDSESRKAKAGRNGGLTGGAARAVKLSAAERSEIAKKAARARWKNK